MNRITKTFSLESLWRGYIPAVTTFSLTLLQKGVTIQLIKGSFERATTNSPTVKLSHFMALYFIVMVAVWTGTFITAWVPVLFSGTVLQRLGLRGMACALTSGLIVGAFLCTLAACVSNLGFNVYGDEPSWRSKCIAAAPGFCIAGLLGGFVYWRRQLRNA